MSYDSISFFCFVFLLWREAEIFYVYLMFIAIKLQYESILCGYYCFATNYGDTVNIV